MGAYLLAGQAQGVRRLAVVFAVVAALALAGFAAAFVFARGSAESQPRFLPPVPSVSERP
jgi:hypothetical protein